MKRAISKEHREEIIRLYLEESPEAAQALADRLLLEPLYARKIVRSRGLMPRIAIRWGQLREASALASPTSDRR
jgi:hypothetical protein